MTGPELPFLRYESTGGLVYLRSMEHSTICSPPSILSIHGMSLHYRVRFDWSALKFSKKMPKYHWNKETGKKFLDDLGNKLKIRSHNDWYNVTVNEIRKHGGGGLYNKYGTLYMMFSSVYPEYPMKILSITVKIEMV